MTIRVMLADDHEIVRQGLRALLAAEPDVEVVAEVGDGRRARDEAVRLSPDVIVMDVAMPELNGMEATRQIVEAAPAVRVLALSMHSDKRFIRQMLLAGASGYLRKGCTFDELVRAIRTVAAGKMYLSPDVARTVTDDYTRRLGDSEKVSAALTSREREVLQLLAEGNSPKQIATRLGIGHKTISTHRHNLMRKTGATGLADLIKYAIREGLTSLEI